MERVGTIQGYTALINKQALGLTCYAMIFGNPVHPSDLDSVCENIKKVKNVLRVYQISGKKRIAIFVLSVSYEHLKDTIKNQFIPLGLCNEEIIIVLQADKEFVSPLEIP
jgi:DNA-binding Lrp family transcriptional regulator